MRCLVVGLFLSFLQSCNAVSAKTDTTGTWVFTKRPALKTPITVFIDDFRYSSQLLPFEVASNYLSYEIGCDIFTQTTDRASADVVITDHQRVDVDGTFLLGMRKDGALILADAGVDTVDGISVYTIRIFGQNNDLERQGRLLAHELLHVLKVGHDDIKGSIMNPKLVQDRDIIIRDDTLSTLRYLYCQAI